MKRPQIISVLCYLGFLSVVFSFPQIFSPGIKKLGVLVPALYGTLVALHFISCVGIWFMKQWGVILYACIFFCKTLFAILFNKTGAFLYFSIVISVFSLVVFLWFFNKMKKNL